MLIISALGKVYIDKKKSTIGVRIANIPLQIVFFFYNIKILTTFDPVAQA